MAAMALTLKVENETSLPDGGALSISIQGKRGIDIGRDQHLDWTLADPDRVVSGKHCEIRWRDNAYWLHDTSTNGTFLLGAETRLPVPYRIRNGDRFLIGRYVVVASIEGQAVDGTPAVSSSSPATYDEIWSTVGDVAPPMNPKQLKAPRNSSPMKADFLEWAIDVPWTTPTSGGTTSAPARLPDTADDMGWAQGARIVPTPAAAAPPMPEPRRPVWTDDASPWIAKPQAAQGRSDIIEKPNPPAPAMFDDQVAPITQTTPRPMRDWSDAVAEPVGPAPLSVNSAYDAPDVVDDARRAGLDRFVHAFSQGTGLPEDVFAGRDPAQLAEQVGHLLRVLTESIKELLQTRQEAKRMARSSDHTTIQMLNNNPLKFAPSTDEAIRLMFASSGSSYLDAPAAFRQGFDDLKSHDVLTYAAMQYALKSLLAEFDPAKIEQQLNDERGLSEVFGSRKASFWDAYVAHWKARTQNRKGVLLNAFMTYFAEHYDEEFGQADEHSVFPSGGHVEGRR